MKRIYILLGILVIAVGTALVFYRNLNHTDAIGTNDFKITEPSKIDKIYLSPNNGKGAYLTIFKEKDGRWYAQNATEKCEADSSNIQTLLNFIMGKLQVKNPVSDAAKPAIVKELSQFGVKVEFYKEGSLHKTMWVGAPTGNFLGTYAFMEKHDRPCIVFVPGFDGFITPYFNVSIDDWRTPVIINAPYEDIAKLKVTWPADPGSSFTITKEGNNLKLFDATGKLSPANGNTVRSFLDRFKGIARATGEPAQINRQIPQRDSVLNGPKLYILEITDYKGKTQKITLYPKAVGGQTYSLNDPAIPGELKTFETDSYWVNQDNNKTLYIIQDIVMNNRMWKFKDFK